MALAPSRSRRWALERGWIFAGNLAERIGRPDELCSEKLASDVEVAIRHCDGKPTAARWHVTAPATYGDLTQQREFTCDDGWREGRC
jgi:hypothetical protein